MKWSGDKAFLNALKGAHEVIQTAAAREVFEVAKDVRDTTLENFGVYGIRMVTGRSRALVAAEPGPGLFEKGKKFAMEAFAGYTKWPSEGDIHSGGEPVEFYPHFLNFGTSRMAARPYYTAAVEKIEAGFQARMMKAVEKGMHTYFKATGAR